MPNPRGPLSSIIGSQAISSANREVEAELARSQTSRKARAPYNRCEAYERSVSLFCSNSAIYTRYSSSQRAKIGKYACIHGVPAAARVYSRKLQKHISETTARSIRDAFREESAKQRYLGVDEDIETMPKKKRGRKVLLGEQLDQKLQQYLTTLRSNGGIVSARVAMAAAKGLLLSLNRGALAEYGGHIKITRHWAYSLFHRMKFVQRKVTTLQSKYTATNFAEVKRKFLDDVAETVEMEEVCPELILNWDQTGIQIVPSSTWTMDREGVSRIEMVGAKDKRQITAVFCCTLQGDFLPVQLIYQGKTSRCHPKFRFPPGWHITHAPKHWSTEQTMVQYVHNIILSYVKLIRELKQDDSASALVIMDNFKGQVTDAIHMLLEENKIFFCFTACEHH